MSRTLVHHLRRDSHAGPIPARAGIGLRMPHHRQVLDQGRVADWLEVHLAAYMAAGLELGASVLVLLGLATRLSVLAFFDMIAVIQTFVYPEAWPDHLQWSAFMLLLPARGPGCISLDALISRRLR